jgi:uncharacterized membrane protein YgcG
MKKLWLSIVFVLLALTLSAQKKSNYEKYWQAREDSITQSQTTLSGNATENQITSVKSEYDDVYYQPSKDGKIVKHAKRKRINQEDTLQAIVDTVVQQNPDVQANYFEYDPFYYSYNLGRFYHGGFNYWMYSDPWFFNNYYMMNNYNWNWEMGFMGNSFWYPWYYDNYGFGFGYFGWGNNWYGHGFNHNNWYNHNNNYYTHNGNHSYNNWYSHNDNHGYAKYNQNVGVHKQTAVQPQGRAMYNDNKRSYSPSYSNPRMSTRPAYNNSRVTTGSVNRRVQANTYSRTYSQPNSQRNTQSRAYSPSNSQRNTQSRAYSVPSRGSVSQSQSRSYSNSNSYNNSGNYSRSSNYSSGSSNYSSGSSSRSSGSYSGGGGGSRSSGGGSGRR